MAQGEESLSSKARLLRLLPALQKFGKFPLEVQLLIHRRPNWIHRDISLVLAFRAGLNVHDVPELQHKADECCCSCPVCLTLVSSVELESITCTPRENGSGQLHGRFLDALCALELRASISEPS